MRAVSTGSCDLPGDVDYAVAIGTLVARSRSGPEITYDYDSGPTRKFSGYSSSGNKINIVFRASL